MPACGRPWWWGAAARRGPARSREKQATKEARGIPGLGWWWGAALSFDEIIVTTFASVVEVVAVLLVLVWVIPIWLAQCLCEGVVGGARRGAVAAW